MSTFLGDILNLWNFLSCIWVVLSQYTITKLITIFIPPPEREEKDVITISAGDWSEGVGEGVVNSLKDRSPSLVWYFHHHLFGTGGHIHLTTIIHVQWGPISCASCCRKIIQIIIILFNIRQRKSSPARSARQYTVSWQCQMGEEEQ